MNKRAQVTLWIILALVLIGVVLLFFFVINKPNGPVTVEESEPKSYIERCARDAVIEAVDIMLPQGGFIEPENYKVFNDIKIEYLCKNIGEFKTCINQHPVYLEDLKNEINIYTPDVGLCMF